MYQDDIAFGDPVDEIHLDFGRPPLGVGTERQAILLHVHHPQEHSLIGAGDAPAIAIACRRRLPVHSITLAFSSASSISYSAPICSSSLSVARASASSTFESANPT